MATVPSTLVLRFFLTPDVIHHIGVICNGRLYFFQREWVQLFDTNNRHVLLFIGSALFKEIVINLTRTEHNAFYLRRIQRINFTNRRLESTVGKIFHTGDTQWMTQQRFRRHHHQRAAHWANHLTTNHVVNLSRGRRNNHLHVLLSTQLQVTL
ncbi:Uncharacterised protein [Vibrio cholerae]|nr:Uncharacterised protein [Vibrio cholerae]